LPVGSASVSVWPTGQRPQLKTKAKGKWAQPLGGWVVWVFFSGATTGMLGTGKKMGNGGVTPKRHRHLSESVER